MQAMRPSVADNSGSDQTESSIRLNILRTSSISAPNEAADIPSPDKKITLFALRLAILEKAASGLGTLGFIWATVVLLGGFAITLEKADFWIVTSILLIESTRIFSRSHELEWQHETSTLSIRDIKSYARGASFKFYKTTSSFAKAILRLFALCASKKGDDSHNTARRAIEPKNGYGGSKRSLSSSNVSFMPYTGLLSATKNVSRLLFWAQLFSASACVGFSVFRLSGQDYGVVSSSEKKNRNSALNIFYGLSLTEALLFLLEKVYWQWKINIRKLLVEVNTEFGFLASEVPTVRQFFYDTYSRCINGSVFDGLKMDFVSFSVESLKSATANGQLTGARVLSSFVADVRFQHDALRIIGTMQDVVERLLEMLNWKSQSEQEIRKSAAQVISILVKKNRNSVRVARIPGSLESIASLLHDSEQDEKEVGGYDHMGFSVLGLHILKNLAKDDDNCSKIGTTKNLLPKIIGFINRIESESRIKVVKLSLKLLRTLASSKGLTGKMLRTDMLQNVFIISNLRDVIVYRGFDDIRLQILAIETLKSFALEGEGRDSIGSIGGVLRNLLSVFFMERSIDHSDDERKEVVAKAGEALTLLALENKNNCVSIVKVNLRQNGSKTGRVIQNLIGVINDPVRRVHSARVLRNLCAYADAHDHDELREIRVAAPQVVKLVMEQNQGTSLEVAMGLAAQILKFFDNLDDFFQGDLSTKRSFVISLVGVLKEYPVPSIRVPSMRRFCVELVISMLEKDRRCFDMVKSELKGGLEGVMESTSDMESYNTLSGSIGLTKHRISIHSLVQTAIQMLED